MNEPQSNSDFARTALHGTAWRYLTFFSGKLMVFISTAVLARLLTKDDFGVVGYAVTTIGFLDVMADMGIGPAIVYHSEDKRTATTAFWLNVVTSITLFGLTWLLAPLVADYFRDPRATEVIRVLGLTYPLTAIGNIHEYLLRKKLYFNRTFLPDFLRAMTKGTVSILLALSGFGAWSLIFGQLSGVLVASLTYWAITPWHPTFTFLTSRARSLLDYGLKYVGSSWVAIILMNVDYLLIGRYLGPEALGVYTLAFRLPDLLILQFARILSTVLFPLYTRLREVSGGLARGFFFTTRYISLITVPLGVGLALVARPFTQVVFTEKWLEAVPVIQAIAIYTVLLSLAYNAGSAYKAQGRPQVITWLGLVRLLMLLPALWWAVTTARSIVAAGWMQATVALFSSALNLYVAARLLRLPLGEVVHALRPSFLAGIMMSGAVLATIELSRTTPPWLQLTIAILTGAATYLTALWLLQRQVLMEAGQVLRAALQRSRG
ncbi:MAG: lipopolysaccharide biosynthesis protein [Anaerolineae bacterium]|nr:MAG: lipopolysaccharide biosynthesis protein [Anaerolineae bacterium]